MLCPFSLTNLNGGASNTAMTQPIAIAHITLSVIFFSEICLGHLIPVCRGWAFSWRGWVAVQCQYSAGMSKEWLGAKINLLCCSSIWLLPVSLACRENTGKHDLSLCSLCAQTNRPESDVLRSSVKKYFPLKLCGTIVICTSEKPAFPVSSHYNNFQLLF